MSVHIPEKSMFAILSACNGAMMESAVLGNTVAHKTDETLKNMQPMYEDMAKQAKQIEQMEQIMQVVQTISIILAPLALIGGGVGAMSGIISTEVVQGAINATVNLAQTVASTLQGTATIGSSQAQGALSLDQAKTDNVSRQSKTLYNSLKGQSTVEQAIAQGTAKTINSYAQASVAHKAH